MEKPAKRAKNFSEDECSVLLELVKQKKHIIECKKTDAVTVKIKTAAWKALSDEFNERFDTNRDWAVLKLKYENLKKSFKRKLADEKANILATGGVPAEHIPNLSPLDWAVKEIIGSTGGNSEFDCDQTEESHWIAGVGAQLSMDVSSDIPGGTDQVEVVIDEETESDLPPPRGPRLQQPISAPLRYRRTRRNRGLGETLAGQRINDLSSRKIELLELQKKVVQQEILHNEEKHNLQMELIRKQIRKEELEIELKLQQLNGPTEKRSK